MNGSNVSSTPFGTPSLDEKERLLIKHLPIKSSTTNDSIDLLATSTLFNLKKRLLEDDLPTSSNITNIISNYTNSINNINNNSSNNNNNNNNKLVGLWTPFTSHPFHGSSNNSSNNNSIPSSPTNSPLVNHNVHNIHHNHHHNSIESLPSMHSNSNNNNNNENINSRLPFSNSPPNNKLKQTTKPIIQLGIVPNSSPNTPIISPVSISESSSLSALALITTSNGNLAGCNSNNCSPTLLPHDNSNDSSSINNSPGLTSVQLISVENPTCPKCSTPATRRHDKRRWWCKQCTKSFTPFRKEKKAIMGDVISNTAPHCCRCFQQATRKHDKRRWWCKQCKKPFTPTQFNLSEQQNQLIYVMGSNKFNEDNPITPPNQPNINNNMDIDGVDIHNSNNDCKNLKNENEIHKKFKDDVIELIYKTGTNSNINNMMNKSKNIEVLPLTPTPSSSSSPLKSSTGINSLLNPSLDGCSSSGSSSSCSINSSIEIIKDSPNKRFKSSNSPNFSSLNSYDLPNSIEFNKDDEEMTKFTLNKLYNINNNSNSSTKTIVNCHVVDGQPLSVVSSPVVPQNNQNSSMPSQQQIHQIISSKYIRNHNITNSYDIINNDEYSKTASSPSPSSSSSTSTTSSPTSPISLSPTCSTISSPITTTTTTTTPTLINSDNNHTIGANLSSRKSINPKTPSEVILDHAIETLIQFNGEEETPFVILNWFEKSNHTQILEKILKYASDKQVQMNDLK